MVHLSNIQIKHDSDTNRFTATIEYCEPSPDLMITEPITGEGDTLTEALDDLCAELSMEGRFA